MMVFDRLQKAVKAGDRTKKTRTKNIVFFREKTKNQEKLRELRERTKDPNGRAEGQAAGRAACHSNQNY